MERNPCQQDNGATFLWRRLKVGNVQKFRTDNKARRKCKKIKWQMGASLLRMLLRHVYCAIVWENTLEKSSPPPPHLHSLRSGFCSGTSGARVLRVLHCIMRCCSLPIAISIMGALGWHDALIAYLTTVPSAVDAPI